MELDLLEDRALLLLSSTLCDMKHLADSTIVRALIINATCWLVVPLMLMFDQGQQFTPNKMIMGQEFNPPVDLLIGKTPDDAPKNLYSSGDKQGNARETEVEERSTHPARVKTAKLVARRRARHEFNRREHKNSGDGST
ncbi:hypothetical protein CHS0354_007028 [Potamilus streckersoni]|uniref:Uncharacterized protein n=1 Tax=Potamilus streckersoni TaxID=2493646 RepID=A0AAE0VK96_9BIVA|nr:hypothetical protein CHS0354_007028 [Potamilus streckersoni]